MSLLDPLSHVLAAIVAAAHVALTYLGADPAAGTTWLLCIAAVVITVRFAMLPLVAHGVRLAHASARARPQLQDLAKRYKTARTATACAAIWKIAAASPPSTGCHASVACRCWCSCRSG